MMFWILLLVSEFSHCQEDITDAAPLYSYMYVWASQHHVQAKKPVQNWEPWEYGAETQRTDQQLIK